MLLLLAMLLKDCECETVLDCMWEGGEFPIAEETLGIDANSRVTSRVEFPLWGRSCY